MIQTTNIVLAYRVQLVEEVDSGGTVAQQRQRFMV